MQRREACYNICRPICSQQRLIPVMYVEKMLTEDTRNRHIKTHLKDPTACGLTYYCGVCGKEVSRADTRKRHEATHGQRPLFTCQICNHSFQRKKHFQQHLQTH